MISAIIHMNASLDAALKICVQISIRALPICKVIWLSVVVIMNVERLAVRRDLQTYKVAAATMCARLPAYVKVTKPKETTVIVGVNARVKIVSQTDAIN